MSTGTLRALGIGLVVAAAASSGCIAMMAGGAAGAAGYAYAKGSKKRLYPQPLQVTIASVESGLADLEITPVSKKIDKVSATIEAKTKSGKSVKVAMKMDVAATEVAIRIGAFGDETLCDQLFSRLDADLNPSQEERKEAVAAAKKRAAEETAKQERNGIQFR